MNSKQYFLFIALMFSLSSCLTKTAGEAHGHDHGAEGHSGHHEGHGHGDELHFTQKQIETVGLQFGEFEDIKINDYIKSTGTLGLPPNAFASVNSKANGIIIGNKKYVEGDYIKKGQVIAFIENPEFIDDQQIYLEAKANLKLKELDLNRQNTLMDANAGIERDLQKIQAEVEILSAKKNGLEKRLNYLGINTSQLTSNTISQQIAIVAPMSGFISSINLHKGMYAQKNVPLMEIIADDHIHLELDIFEKDISLITVGQEISYTVPALGSKSYMGEISVIGKEFNHNAKTVRVHGHLEGEIPPFIKDLFVNAKIWLNDETTKALPEAAIIADGESSFIYTANYDPYAAKTFFTKLQVIPGNTENGMTAVRLLKKIPADHKVVTKGAYFVYSESMVDEIEHNH